MEKYKSKKVLKAEIVELLSRLDLSKSELIEIKSFLNQQSDSKSAQISDKTNTKLCESCPYRY